jgi:hypothetical protein
MSITVTCVCGKTATVKDGAAGKRLKCPDCGGAMLVPSRGNSPAAGAPGLSPFEKRLLNRADLIDGTLLSIRSRLGWIVILLAFILWAILFGGYRVIVR